MALKKCFLFLFLFNLTALRVFSQVAGDSTPVTKPDTPHLVHRSAVHKPVLYRSFRVDSAKLRDTTKPPVPTVKAQPIYRTDSVIYTKHPFYRFTDPVRFITASRKWEGKEGVFYMIVGLLIFFAIIRNAFARYLNDLFRLYFRATLKQRQIREQLMQAVMPSLLLNILYFVSAGLFVALLFQHYRWASEYEFWMLLVYAITALLLIYLIKFIVLKLFGWIFRVMDAMDAYIFIVFTNNKIAGILLLPFILFLAFTNGVSYEIAFSFSLVVIAGLFTYRFFIAYVTVQRQLKINFFHFLIYLVAFEVAPLLLINKLLLKYIIERY